MMREFLHNIKQLVYPHICVGCMERALPMDQLICIRCATDIPFTSHFDTPINKVVEHFYGRIPISFGAAMLYFSKNSTVQNLLHQLKYNNQDYIGTTLGEFMGEKYKACNYFPKADLIVPVPMHRSKEIRRGYNQAEVIAKGVVSTTNIPMRSDILVKIIDTESQTNKSREERMINVENSIGIKHKEEIFNKNILLVDDVVTTGATLEASGKVLLSQGANSVSILVAGAASKGFL